MPPRGTGGHGMRTRTDPVHRRTRRPAAVRLALAAAALLRPILGPLTRTATVAVRNEPG